MKLLDTTFLVDFLRKKNSVKEKIITLGPPLCTTRINVFETLAGIFSIKLEADRRRKLGDFQILFNSLQILELDEKSALIASQISGYLNIQGNHIEAGDCLIAGIALSNGINTIVTKNVKDYQKIEGLKVEGY